VYINRKKVWIDLPRGSNISEPYESIHHCFPQMDRSFGSHVNKEVYQNNEIENNRLSFAFFVSQDSNFGNCILPVLPR